MDPLSQGVLGAALPQASASSKHIRMASMMGFLSGMAPDLDVLIRSNTDPLLFLEYHRQFSHSLVFIPIGGLICALLFYYLLIPSATKLRSLLRSKAEPPASNPIVISLLRCWLYCSLGYATHGLLDACTTYGTMLLWPFSDMRVAWNTLSIIDPLYTLPLLTLIITAAIKRNPRLAQVAMVWAIAYPAIGFIQQQRAEHFTQQLAQQRGHQAYGLSAKPSFANLLVWKTIYETDHRYYIDAVRVGAKGRIYEGQSIEKLDIGRDIPWLKPNSQQAKDIERFRWFSIGYIARDPVDPNRIIDIRYSMIPNEINALWGIDLSPSASPQQHVGYSTSRDIPEDRTVIFKQMLLNQ